MFSRLNYFICLLISILVIAACNNDDEDMPEAPQSSFSIKGISVDPVTGNESAWNSNAIDVRFGAQGLSFRAGVGSDTLYVAVEGLDSGMYVIDGFSNLSTLNRYEAASPIDSNFTLYTYKADNSGGLIFNILENDSARQRIKGNFSAQYFNPVNNSDFFQLDDAEFDISYAPPPGEPGFVPGVGEISFFKDGAQQDYDDAIAFSDLGGGITIQGVIAIPGEITQISLELDDTLGVDTFFFGNDVVNAVYSETIGALPNSFFADSGSVEITMHDTINKNISGKFSFKGINTVTAEDSIYVTEGEFDVNYSN